MGNKNDKITRRKINSQLQLKNAKVLSINGKISRKSLGIMEDINKPSWPT
jgi:hypothetical protein